MGQTAKSNKVVKTQSELKERVRMIVRRDGGFYAIYEVLKKVKFKNKGKVSFEKPLFSLLVHVVESNLPLPANTPNPIFMFKREKAIVVPDDKGDFQVFDGADEYCGMPTPEEYFTLPDWGNHINADLPEQVKLPTPVDDTPDPGRTLTEYRIGLHYLSSMFVKQFESAEDADAFLAKMHKDLQVFLLDLEKFWQVNEKSIGWGKMWTHGTTKSLTDTVSNDVMIPSFTEGKGRTI